MNIIKFYNKKKKEIFFIGIILILLFSRLIPHPPNVTPIISVAILSSYFFKNYLFSIIAILLSMLISDFVIGNHSGMFIIYFSIAMVCFYSFRIVKGNIKKKLYFHCFVGSLIFFIISNLGVWLFGNIYQRDIAGFLECYFMAIPFFGNTLLSTMFFSYTVYFANDYFKKVYLY